MPSFRGKAAAFSKIGSMISLIPADSDRVGRFALYSWFKSNPLLVKQATHHSPYSAVDAQYRGAQ